MSLRWGGLATAFLGLCLDGVLVCELHGQVNDEVMLVRPSRPRRDIPRTSTFQTGDIVYLETITIGNTTTRIGINLQWGGSVVELSVNGKNYVNHFDAGREIQVGLYDGDGKYVNCCIPGGVFGWDPVQGGDKYTHGSKLLEKTIAADYIYVKLQPLQWNPDDKGGGSNAAVLSDMFFEQWIYPVPDSPQAFRLHYKLTHFGQDSHTVAGQEFPAIYANLGYDRFVSYDGLVPWTNGAVKNVALPSSETSFYITETWQALVDDQGMGLTVHVPGQFPFASGFTIPGSAGETGEGANYLRPQTAFSFPPNSTFEAEYFVFAGDYKLARQKIYELHSASANLDMFPPFGYVDLPTEAAQIKGMVLVAGWCMDNQAVTKVEVLVDGIVNGVADYGVSRPDIPAAFPHAPPNTGFQYTLNTTLLGNGNHLVQARCIDSSNQSALIPGHKVTVNNP